MPLVSLTDTAPITFGLYLLGAAMATFLVVVSLIMYTSNRASIDFLAAKPASKTPGEPVVWVVVCLSGALLLYCGYLLIA